MQRASVNQKQVRRSPFGFVPNYCSLSVWAFVKHQLFHGQLLARRADAEVACPTFTAGELAHVAPLASSEAVGVGP